jgi:methylase of polypeptide subunit release factors
LLWAFAEVRKINQIKIIDAKLINDLFGVDTPIFTKYFKVFLTFKNNDQLNQSFQSWKDRFPYIIESIMNKQTQPQNNAHIEDFLFDYYTHQSYCVSLLFEFTKIIHSLHCFEIPQNELKTMFLSIDNNSIFKLFGCIFDLNFLQKCSNKIYDQIQSLISQEYRFVDDDLFGILINEILKFDIKEQKGMYFTPKILATFLNEQIGKNLLNKSNKSFLDPTCGTGSILLGIIRRICHQFNENHNDEPNFGNIIGIDENPIAILASIVNIWFLLHHNEINNIESWKLIPQQFHCLDIFSLFQMKRSHPLYQKFDIIVGNLPWNVYNNITSPNLKIQIETIGKHYDLFMTWKNKSNLEVSTVLFEVIRDNLTKTNGILAFLLPASLLTASQHSKFRRFTELKNIRCYNLYPDLFPIHTMAMIAERSLEPLQKLTNEDKVEKEIDNYHIKFDLDQQSWKITEKTRNKPAYTSIHRGKRLIGKYVPINEVESQIPVKKSYYFPKVYRGVDITPRRLLFVDYNKEGNIAHIKPDLTQNVSTQSKRWNIIPFEDAIIDFNDIKLIVKSTDIIPLKIIGNHPAFIPLTIEKGSYRVKNSSEMSKESFDHYQILNEVYSTNRNPNSKNTTLKASLEYGKKLFQPGLLEPLKLIYPVGGSYCKGAILRSSEEIIDVTLYYLCPASEDEAYYLLAWVNSNLLNKNLFRVCTVGANGSIRVIHMAPWMFPLPKFDPTKNIIFDKITELGRQLEKGIQDLYFLNNILPSEKNINQTWKKPSLAKIYRLIKNSNIIQSLLQNIDNFLLELFTKM